MTNVLKIGKPVRKGKKKKVNLLGALFGAGKNAHDGYQKRHHSNLRRVKLGVGKRPAVKRIANNHPSNSGKQMR